MAFLALFLYYVVKKVSVTDEKLRKALLLAVYSSRRRFSTRQRRTLCCGKNAVWCAPINVMAVAVNQRVTMPDGRRIPI